MSAEQTPDIEALAARLFLADPDRVEPGPWMSMAEVHQRPYRLMARAATDVFAPVLAAAVREAKVRELREAADDLPKRTEGTDRAGTETWRAHDRDVYSLAIEEAQAALRDRADRVAEPQHEAATSGKESEASDE